MKNIYILLTIAIFSFINLSALEPLKVAFVKADGAAANISIEVKDYSNAGPALYTQNFGSLTPNTSGIVSFTVGIGETAWANLNASSINTFTTIDILVNSTLFVQYRLDGLVLSQAQASLMNISEDGSLVPDDEGQSLGTNDDRWGDLFVGPTSVHIGEENDEGVIQFDVQNDKLEVSINGSKELTIGTTETTIEDSIVVKEKLTTGGLVVKSSTGVKGDHIALFENTQGTQEADGIAIKIDTETLSFRNRFVTFYGKDDYLAGRIESYDLLGGDLWESFPTPDFNTLFDVFDFTNVLTFTPPSLTFSGGALPSASFNPGTLPTATFNDGSLPSINFTELTFDDGSLPSLNFNGGSLPSLTFDPGALPTASFDPGNVALDFTGIYDPQAGASAAAQLGLVAGWGMRNGSPGFFPTSPWQIAATPLILAAKQIARNQGIVYGSKGADYAEWLEKENPEDSFVFGEVVGVKGGKISKNTTDADQVMSISMNPIVLGNMPPKDEEGKYEKVGFLGQVPVLVVGNVEIGDYIVASGNNDGYAVAVSIDELELEDLNSVIGRAWSSSEGRLKSLINVSVGIKTNEWVTILEKQNEKMNSLEERIKKLEHFNNNKLTKN
jgi:hypothetical protein